jgi:hypothetical protein
VCSVPWKSRTANTSSASSGAVATVVDRRVGFVNSVVSDLQANRASQVMAPQSTPMVSGAPRGHRSSACGRAAESALTGIKQATLDVAPIGGSSVRCPPRVARCSRSGQEDSPANEDDRVYEPYARRTLQRLHPRSFMPHNQHPPPSARTATAARRRRSGASNTGGASGITVRRRDLLGGLPHKYEAAARDRAVRRCENLTD